MQKHILEEKAYTYELPKRNDKIKGAFWNDEKGFWVTKSGNPCMEDKKFPKPTTKKCDIETGEDQKGE